ncbi:Mitochondrial matrix iron chaperone [Thecaphora frezii]
MLPSSSIAAAARTSFQRTAKPRSTPVLSRAPLLVAYRCAPRATATDARSSRPAPPPAALPSTTRRFSTTPHRSIPPSYTASKLDTRIYHALSNQTLDLLTEQFESLIEESDVEALERRAAERGLTSRSSEWDVECATGVMNLRLGPYGTYVINKQPPNQQIWLSSPISGPKRFDYDEQHNLWFSLKEGQLTTLKQLLDAELTRVFDTHVDLDLELDVEA